MAARKGATGTASARKGTGSGRRRGTAEDIQDRILTITLELIAARGWRALSPSDIAAAANISVAELRRHFPSKQALLDAFVDRIDTVSLEGIDEAEGEPHRDRLFDALMRRFDALSPHKPAIRALMRGVPTDPMASLSSTCRMARAMGWTLEAAGIRSTGLLGRARVKALMAIYLGAIAVWLRDDTPEMARTMAFLDKRLAQAERLEGLVGRGFGLNRQPQPGAEAP